MEENASSMNPLLLLWQSPTVRQHVVTAARELALAAQAGLQELQAQVTQRGLTEQYPYLQAALGNLQSTVGAWIGGVCTPGTPSSRRKTQRADHAPSPRRASRKKGDKHHYGSRRTA